MGAELFHADRRTGMTKLIVAFRNFANAPKKWPVVYVIRGHYTYGLMLRGLYSRSEGLEV